jgi:hypothetical protein
VDHAPRYTKSWLADGRILCYLLDDTTTLTINAWAADLTQELNGWPSSRPWRMMLDIRLNGNIVSPFALRRARAIANLRPDLPGQLAILIGSHLAAQIISIALRSAPNSYRRRACFASEVMAIAWLLEDSDQAGKG